MNPKSTLINENDTEVFTQVGEIWDNLRKNVLGKTTFKPAETLSEWLQILTGSFMYLNTRYAQARIARDSNEVSAYMRLKGEADAAGAKFVNAAAEREAKSEVVDFVEAERILESYKDASEQGILTLKKLLDVQILELREAR